MDIKQKVLSIFKDVIGIQVTVTDTCEDLEFDSIDKALVALEIEETFSIEVADEDFDKANNVGDFINIVTNKYNNVNTK